MLVSSNHDEKLRTLLTKESSLLPISSIKDLADYIQKFNRGLNDTTIVYCQGEDGLESPTTKVAVRLMRQESSNPILTVSDKELSAKMRMEPGKFYIYYKPSFINGFEQYMDKDINFNFLQAFEGVCRDEFQVIPAYVESEEFKTFIGANKGLHTERFAKDIFDACFKRSYNVDFSVNPDFKEFRSKFKHPSSSQKPLLFIYSPAMYMSRYIGEFKEVLKNYREVFDIYYTDDESEASEIFFTKEFPEIFPYVVIVDPKKRKAVRSAKAELE